MSALLEVRGVSKAFPGVKANDEVGFEVGEGEIHALLGENGAGKSTLVKMIYGILQPDAGGFRWQGAPFAPASPGEARTAGIGLVFQHFSLFDALSVTENVALGLPPDRTEGLAARIREVSAGYGLPLEPTRVVGDLSVGERQRVEVVRCLLQSPRLLIMDEPTSVLTPQEADALFATLRTLRDQGVSVLYISHKLEEIRALCSRATVLRGGRVVAVCDPREETAGGLAEMMIGRRLAAPGRGAGRTPGEARLAVEGLSLPPAGPFGVALHDVSFTLRAGEILGVAGVAGNGQDELVAALSGERRSPPGAIRLEGRAIGALGPARRRRLGLHAAPEERLGHAAAPEMSLTRNAFVTARRRLAPHGLLRLAPARRFAEAVVEAFDVRTAGVGRAARSLSGGNLQKWVIGREVLQSPRVFVVAQPTWGVDAGAAQAIREALRDLAASGCAVLAVSQDLDELLALSDRLAVVAGGRLSPPQPTQAMSVAEIGLLMGGAPVPPAPAAGAAA